MADETDPLLDATMGLLPHLLTVLEALERAGRHLHPPHVSGLAEALEGLLAPLQDNRATFEQAPWPEHLAGFRDALAGSADHAAKALAGFGDAVSAANPVMAAYAATGHAGRAVATLYPVAFMLPPVNRFFVAPELRDDAELLERLGACDPSAERAGIIHAENESQQRGGCSIYVPEYYDETHPYPLVVALHGGSGHGRSFLWTWLRDARSRGAIVISPTSRQNTWSLTEPEIDLPGLDGLVERAQGLWNVDKQRILLTGMSDGGTFSYLGGLRDDSPFTHLAPISGSFHPFVLEGCGGQRLSGLPIYLVHGALDWMFPADMARMACNTLKAAGANITYRELEDLSHTYPREENQRILDWLMQS
ncbi:MAG: phospholipase [Gammaproteobacteria bacterium]|nr:phospholipase [Gammaproteobacteria bacterium]|tara:strand:+ start:14195 stop:15286 length:1092 start_codon:yes stop_codon:yes gene_type:complete